MANIHFLHAAPAQPSSQLSSAVNPGSASPFTFPSLKYGQFEELQLKKKKGLFSFEKRLLVNCAFDSCL